MENVWAALAGWVQAIVHKHGMHFSGERRFARARQH